MQKKHYEIPEAELLLVRFEENFLASDPDYTLGGGGQYNLDKINDLGEY